MGVRELDGSFESLGGPYKGDRAVGVCEIHLHQCKSDIYVNII